MKIVKKIRLLDGSEHPNKKLAERHLSNMLSQRPCLDLFEALAGKNAIETQIAFVENLDLVEQTLQVVRELKEVEQLDFYE